MLSTVLKVAAVALFTLLTVRAQTPSTGGCGSYSWTELQSTHQLQGVGTNDQTQDACKQSCVANSSCTGLDWDASASTKCYLHGYWSGAKVVATGVLHVDITRTGSSCADCTARWSDIIADTNVAGGTAYSSAKSPNECKAACVQQPTCYGIDWDINGAIQCWLTGNGPKRIGQAPNVQHYDLTYRPDPVLCSQGCILYTQIGLRSTIGVIRVSGVDLSIVQDINMASVFLESPCLAKTIPGNSYNGSCLSYLDTDQPGNYIHIAFSVINVLSADWQASRSLTDRFKEDASFVKVPYGGDNQFRLRSVVYDYIYVANSGYLLPAPSTSLDLVNFYCGRPSLNDVTTITGSCPRVWSRIDNAAAAGYQSSYYSSCRQYALVYWNNTIGVTEYKNYYDVCYFATQSDQYVRPNQNANYYELLSAAASGKCKRGCVSTWTKVGSTLVSNWNISVSTIDECQQACLSNSVCKGIIVRNYPYCNNAYTNADADLLMNPVFTDCANMGSVGLMYGFTDPSAVATVAVSQTDECLTACLNRITCYGYEIRNGICYLSVNENAIFADGTSDTVHTVVIRNPNGNGCVHKWDFLVNSKYDSGTQSMPSVTTERDCRMECIKLATCTGCDWDTAAKICTLGINNPSITKFGNSPGFNHFELQRGANCDN